MKKQLLLCLLAVGFWATGQNNVRFVIEHELNGQPFTMGMVGQNNLGHSFDVNRLEYYVSGIQLTHDGGQVIDLPDAYFLVQGDQILDESLGSLNITQIEAITFAVGVDTARNHLDPNSWPMTHPLAPKNPSMHWGWTAGYRFSVMEGTSGAGFNQFYEFHALGNKNYNPQEIQTAGEMDNGDIVIRLIADYAEAVHNIPLDQGMIQHGQDDEAAEFLGNFELRVFKSSDGNGPTASVVENNRLLFQVFPNPAADYVELQLSHNATVDGYLWRTIDGRIIERGNYTGGAISTPLESGVFLLEMYSGPEFYGSQRVLIQR